MMPIKHARLWLDTEFNGHGGELISLALMPETGWGDHFYGIKAILHPDAYHPWVREHVMPVLTKDASPWPDTHIPPSQPSQFQADLHRFLRCYPQAHIYADWPMDFGHFAACLAGPTFEQALAYQCTMHLIDTPPGVPESEIPHNALADAMALMRWYRREHG